MRALAVVCVVACTGKAAAPDAGSVSADPCARAGEGLPPPVCGTTGGQPCRCCTSCSIADGLCFGDTGHFALGIGECRANAATGSLAMTVDGAQVSAREVAAIGFGAYVEISARFADTSTVTFLVPAAAGTYGCGVLALELYYVAASGSLFRSDATCTAMVTGSDLISGTFAASVGDSTTTIALANGTFSVARGPFP